MGQGISRQGGEDDPFDTSSPSPESNSAIHHALLMGVSNSGKTAFAKMANKILEGSMSRSSIKFREELLSCVFAWLLLIVAVKKKLFPECEFQYESSVKLVDKFLLTRLSEGKDSLGENESLLNRCRLQVAIVKPEILWSDKRVMQDISLLWATEPILHKIYTLLYYNKISPEFMFLYGNTQIGSVISGDVMDETGKFVNSVPKQPQWQHFEHLNFGELAICDFVINLCIILNALPEIW